MVNKRFFKIFVSFMKDGFSHLNNLCQLRVLSQIRTALISINFNLHKQVLFYVQKRELYQKFIKYLQNRSTAEIDRISYNNKQRKGSIQGKYHS